MLHNNTMDRLAWCDGLLSPDEQLVLQQNGIRLYDGDDKVKIIIFFQIKIVYSFSEFRVISMVKSHLTSYLSHLEDFIF